MELYLNPSIDGQVYEPFTAKVLLEKYADGGMTDEC